MVHSAFQVIYYFLFNAFELLVQDFVCMSQAMAKKKKIDWFKKNELITVNGYKPVLKDSVHSSWK